MPAVLGGQLDLHGVLAQVALGHGDLPGANAGRVGEPPQVLKRLLHQRPVVEPQARVVDLLLHRLLRRQLGHAPTP